MNVPYLFLMHMNVIICNIYACYMLTVLHMPRYFNTVQRYLNVESVVIFVGFNKQYSYKTVVIKLHTIAQHKINQ